LLNAERVFRRTKIIKFRKEFVHESSEREICAVLGRYRRSSICIGRPEMMIIGPSAAEPQTPAVPSHVTAGSGAVRTAVPIKAKHKKRSQIIEKENGKSIASG
jgi:hypothetical protein